MNDTKLSTIVWSREASPEPLVIKIDRFKATIQKRQISGVAAAISVAAPRAG